MVFLVLVLQPFEDLERLLNGRLGNLNLLKTPRQSAVLLEIFSVLVIRRRADAPKISVDQRRFENVGGIHGAAGHRTCPHDVMDLIDKQDRPLLGVGQIRDQVFGRLEGGATGNLARSP